MLKKKKFDLVFVLFPLILALIIASCISCQGVFYSGNYKPAILRYSNVKPELREAYEASAVVTDPNGRVLGAGTVLIRQPGEPITILTAYHVVDSFYEAVPQGNPYVKLLPENTLYKTVIVKRNPTLDLALLETVSKATQYAAIAKVAQNDARIGERVLAFGSPAGIERNLTVGVVSNVVLNPTEDSRTLVRYYRTDADLWFGNSGGGLFNARGELIGVAVQIELYPSGGGFGVIPGSGLVVHTTHVRDFLLGIDGQ